jgi:hypothetical protein
MQKVDACFSWRKILDIGLYNWVAVLLVIVLVVVDFTINKIEKSSFSFMDIFIL